MSKFRPWLLLLGLIPIASLAMLDGSQAQKLDAEIAAQPAEAIEPAQSVPSPAADKTADSEREKKSYHWIANRRGSRLRIRGLVPSEEDRRIVLGMVKAHFPDLSVDEQLKVSEESPSRELWLGGVSFALKQLSHMERGTVRLSGLRLSVDGHTRTAADYKEVKKALESSLPPSLSLATDSVRPPAAKPFIFRADLSGAALTLSGSVPDEEVRKALLALTRELFGNPALHDELQLASGAPSDWDDAAIAALRALSRLESGMVALNGVALTIEGLAPDEPTAVAIAYQLRRDLPAPFEAQESIKWREAAKQRSGENASIIGFALGATGGGKWMPF
jgi:hypothetical protein